MHRVLTFISIALPTLAGIALAATYDALPDTWPVHWSITGVGDKFWAKSVPLVFSHVLTAFGALLVLHLYVPSEPRFRRYDPQALLAVCSTVGASLSLLLSLLAIRPLAPLFAPRVKMIWLLAPVTAVLIVTVAWGVTRLSSRSHS